MKKREKVKESASFVAKIVDVKGVEITEAELDNILEIGFIVPDDFIGIEVTE